MAYDLPPGCLVKGSLSPLLFFFLAALIFFFLLDIWICDQCGEFSAPGRAVVGYRVAVEGRQEALQNPTLIRVDQSFSTWLLSSERVSVQKSTLAKNTTKCSL